MVQRSEILLSVIIVTRNRATYLNFTLAALERQTLPQDSWELIVVDDSSQDDTTALLDRFERISRLCLVRIHTNTRRNHGELLNEAIAASKGRYLVFLAENRIAQPDFLLQHLFFQGKTE